METSYSLLLFDNDKTVGKTTSKSNIHTVLGPWVQIFKGSKIDFGVISTDPHLIFEMTLWSCLKVNRGELWRQGGALVNFLEHWDIYIPIWNEPWWWFQGLHHPVLQCGWQGHPGGWPVQECLHLLCEAPAADEEVWDQLQPLLGWHGGT